MEDSLIATPFFALSVSEGLGCSSHWLISSSSQAAKATVFSFLSLPAIDDLNQNTPVSDTRTVSSASRAFLEQSREMSLDASKETRHQNPLLSIASFVRCPRITLPPTLERNVSLTLEHSHMPTSYLRTPSPTADFHTNPDFLKPRGMEKKTGILTHTFSTNLLQSS